MKALDESLDIIKTRYIKLKEELEFIKLGIKTNSSDEKDVDNFKDDTVSIAIRGYLQELEDLRYVLKKNFIRFFFKC